MSTDLFRSRLQIDVETRESEIRIVLRGELDIGNAAALEEALLAAEAAPSRLIRLDLRELEFLDSTGLRAILAAQLRSAVDDDRLRITPGSERVQRLFAVTGTTDLLHFEDESNPPDNVVTLDPAEGGTPREARSAAGAVIGDLRFEVQPADRAPASTLIEAMLAELTPLYGRVDVPGAPGASPQDFAPPHGGFVVGYAGAEPVCGGGVKRLALGRAEIKRMFVVPEARGQGVARRLLRALELEAWRLGYERVCLDTGPRQPHARELYLAAGYREIADYNANPFASFWGEKVLDGVDRERS